MSPADCGRCGDALEHRVAFRLASAGGLTYRCARCALLYGPMLARSVRTALVVGTLLALVNQGDLLLGGEWSADLAWKVPLTYAVPFLVATWGALGTSKVIDRP